MDWLTCAQTPMGSCRVNACIGCPHWLGSQGMVFPWFLSAQPAGKGFSRCCDRSRRAGQQEEGSTGEISEVGNAGRDLQAGAWVSQADHCSTDSQPSKQGVLTSALLATLYGLPLSCSRGQLSGRS